MRAPAKASFLISLSIIIILSVLYLAIYKSGSTNDAIVSPTPKLTDTEIKFFQKEITGLLNSEGPDSAIDYIKTKVSDTPAFARECHPLMHYVGHEIYHYSSDDFSEAISQTDNVCNSGMVHGVIESLFEHKGSGKSIVAQVCSNDESWSLQAWQCYHGVGHGFMQSNARHITKTIINCLELDDEIKINACANGAYMEQFILTSHFDNTKRNLSQAHIDICLEEDDFKGECYLYAPTAYLEANPNSYREAFLEYCLEGEVNQISTCRHGVAAQMIKENIASPQKAIEHCKSFDKDFDNCISGVISGYFFNSDSSKAEQKTCEIIFEDYEEDCLVILGNRLK